MPEIPSRGHTAYVCECGKKWIFDKTTAAAVKPLRRACKCGRTVVVAKGLVYSVPTARGN